MPIAAESGADLSRYSPTFVLTALVMTAVTAGIAEEAGFRGYMQGPIERRHGFPLAVTLTGTAFALAHLGPGTSPDRLVWSVFVAIIFGFVASCTESILPSVVLHSSWDIAVPLLLYSRGPGFHTLLPAGFAARGGLDIVGAASTGLAAWWALQRLRKTVRQPKAS